MFMFDKTFTFSFDEIMKIHEVRKEVRKEVRSNLLP